MFTISKNSNGVKKTCPYCGNNPVPHQIVWYNESLNILMTGFRQRLLYNPLTQSLKQKGWDASIAKFFLKLGESLKIITRQNNPALCKVRRAQVLWEEAESRDIKMSELLLFGRAFDCYVAERQEGGGKIDQASSLIPHPSSLIFSGLPRPQGYFNNYLDLMDDKAWFKEIMIKNNIPVARGGSCTSFSQAEKIYNEINIAAPLIPHPSSLIPLITKPRSGSRGRHSITFIYTLEDLKKAFKIAKKLCHWVMVEEQLFGPVYRATVINFELAGVLRGDAPQVVGDGAHTIKELVDIKNAMPQAGVKNIIIDSLAEVFLSRQNFTPSSIPQKGQAVSITEKVGVSYGGSSAEEFDICHPDNKELFVKAAKVLGDPIVGFDFIIPDITKSYKQQKCGFLEANTLPFINLHHDPLHGEPRNVAARVWDMNGM